MIVSIKKDDDVLDYDLSKIKDDDAKRDASIIVTKVGLVPEDKEEKKK